MTPTDAVKTLNQMLLKADDPDEQQALNLAIQALLVEPEHAPSPSEVDAYIDHVYCNICRECVTCNLRPCRDGKEHTV